VMPFGKGQIFFMGDTNTIEDVPQPLVDNLLQFVELPIPAGRPSVGIPTTQNPERTDFLWEIGSGSNWLSYHVAITLALQEYFIELRGSPVPSFLVYDQPSQVYFPRRLADRPGDIAEEPTLRDQDVEAVRKIFRGMSTAIEHTRGTLQIIVLDHAADTVWNDIPRIHPVADWRAPGEALIPPDWIG
jgi:Protein of unknown function (DUF3732)